MLIRELRIDELEKRQPELFILIKDASILSFPQLRIEDSYINQQLQSMKVHMEKQEAVVFVAENKDSLNGLIWCHEIVRVVEKRLHIAHFCVKPQCRREGIGTLLLKEAEKYAADHCCLGIDLIVTVSNTNAVYFYEHNSFQVERFLMSKKVPDQH